MTRTLLYMAAMCTVMLAAGCIVSDQLVTMTIQPDGSGDWVRVLSNIRSTEKGAKGAQELKEYVAKFDANQDDDYVRITESGGAVLESRWIRAEEPYASLMVGRFPNAAALENFSTIKGEKGEVVAKARFTSNGNRRKMSMVIPIPKEEQPAEKKALPTFQEFRQNQANGISETRVAVVGGRIIASQGFVVAADKRSALLDVTQLEALLESKPEQVELFLEWELGE